MQAQRSIRDYYYLIQQFSNYSLLTRRIAKQHTHCASCPLGHVGIQSQTGSRRVYIYLSIFLRLFRLIYSKIATKCITKLMKMKKKLIIDPIIDDKAFSILNSDFQVLRLKYFYTVITHVQFIFIKSQLLHGSIKTKSRSVNIKLHFY